MGLNSKIEWTDHTFNPWWGCVKVSPGCDNCYAESFSKRTGNSVWGKDAPRRFFGDAHWNEPLKWDRDAERDGVRRRVFCASMADVMEDRRDLDDSRTRLYSLIQHTPHLDWLLLTKRPQNFRRLLPATWVESPQPNVWLMTTVESDEYIWRVKELLTVPAVVRGVSYEPAVGPLNLDGYPVDWVIAGGESGHKARPAQADWFRSMRDQCANRGISFFLKQWGEWLPSLCDGAVFDGKSQQINSSDEPIRIGKKAAGALLDGREHKEFPIPRTVTAITA